MGIDTHEYNDTQIRDALLLHKVITNKRVYYCGKRRHKYRMPNMEWKYHLFRCNEYECRVCRRKKLEKIHIKNIVKNRSFRNQGGEHLMLTLTLPHKPEQKLYSIYKRFSTAMTNMKRGTTWKTLKRDTNCQYHYYKWEIPKDNPNHIHCHIVFAIIGNLLPIKEIKDRLLGTWERFAKKKGFRNISKRNAVKITETPEPVQEIDNYLYKDGRLEELEYLSAKSKIDKHSGKILSYKSAGNKGVREKQIDKEIRQINSCFRGTVRQRIYNNKKQENNE